jgi:hypothetical protein
VHHNSAKIQIYIFAGAAAVVFAAFLVSFFSSILALEVSHHSAKDLSLTGIPSSLRQSQLFFLGHGHIFILDSK